MSAHFEVVYSMFLRDDTPAEVLDDLRWHMGLSDVKPPVSAIYQDHRVLDPGRDTYIPGGEQAALIRQLRYGHDHYAWGLYIRLFWLDDQWAEVWYIVAGFLAPYVEEDGYAGFYREEHEPVPTLLLIEGGKPHLRDLAERPEPFGFRS